MVTHIFLVISFTPPFPLRMVWSIFFISGLVCVSFRVALCCGVLFFSAVITSSVLVLCSLSFIFAPSEMQTAVSKNKLSGDEPRAEDLCRISVF